MTTTTTSAGAIARAAHRLEKTTTRLTRARARRALRSACNAILKAFPPLDREGRAPAPRTAPVCPLCRIPCKDWLALATHLRRKHCPEPTAARCPCCHEVFSNKQHRSTVARHLAALARAGRLQEHAIAGATAHAFKDGKQ
jgi:hypothetical protein